jgi:hypothetical protein
VSGQQQSCQLFTDRVAMQGEGSVRISKETDDDDDDFKFNECMQASGPMTLDTTENGRNYLVKRKL